jgi:hypothetical protein
VINDMVAKVRALGPRVPARQKEVA